MPVQCLDAVRSFRQPWLARRVYRKFVGSPTVPTAGLRVASDEYVHTKHCTVKRAVAVHFGYIGTGFKGLQFQRDEGTEDAVEDVLERAVAAAGGILPSNLGKTHKTGWSRSSRTDKGVHSLSTVAAFKLECRSGDAFEQDPEGVDIAKEINSHLPSQIRVFSVQRTQKAFDARKHCKSRSYQYFVPAAVLGLKGSAREDDEIFKRLKECLALFQGTHPFHNYTERRRYRKDRQQRLRARASELWEQRSRRADGAEETAQMIMEASRAPDSGGRAQDPTNGNNRRTEDGDSRQMCSQASRFSIRSSTDELRDDVGRTAGSGQGRQLSEIVQAAKKPKKFVWLHEPEERDLVSRAHYRHILRAEASEVLRLVPGGEPCVQITFQGSSFMVYQIRHMVAAAVCAATRRLPLDLIAASLCVHSRVALPLAPPQGLVLANSSFFGFPRAANGDPHPVTQISGEALTLRERGKAARDSFCAETLWPALDKELSQLQFEEWGDISRWAAAYSSEDVRSLLEAYGQWTIQKMRRSGAQIEDAVGVSTKSTC